YLQDAEGSKIRDAARLEQIRGELMAVLERARCAAKRPQSETVHGERPAPARRRGAASARSQAAVE
ncbi:MAG: hypothetical protein V3T57_10665, partial [Kiloniellales bacterium]